MCKKDFIITMLEWDKIFVCDKNINSNSRTSESNISDPLQTDTDDEAEEESHFESTIKTIDYNKDNLSTPCRRVTRKMEHSKEDSATIMLEITEGTKIPRRLINFVYYYSDVDSIWERKTHYRILAQRAVLTQPLCATLKPLSTNLHLNQMMWLVFVLKMWMDC